MAIKIVLTGEEALEWAEYVSKYPDADFFGVPAVVDTQTMVDGGVRVPIPGAEHVMGATVEVDPAEPPKRIRRTKEQIAADFHAKEAADYKAQMVVASDILGAAMSEAVTMEAVSGADPLLDSSASSLSGTPTGSDDLDLGMPVSDDLMPAIVEISDGELQAAAAKFCTTKREPGNRTFRVILGKYATQVADIPQDRRQAFLGELKAVT